MSVLIKNKKTMFLPWSMKQVLWNKINNIIARLVGTYLSYLVITYIDNTKLCTTVLTKKLVYIFISLETIQSKLNALKQYYYLMIEPSTL